MLGQQYADNYKNHQCALFQSLVLTNKLKKIMTNNNEFEVGQSNGFTENSFDWLSKCCCAGLLRLLRLSNVEKATEPQCLHILVKSMCKCLKGYGLGIEEF